MKINVLFLLFVAFIIICQDNKKEYSSTGGPAPAGGGAGGGGWSGGGASQTGGPGSGGGGVGRGYGLEGNLDRAFIDRNPYQGRVSGPFHFNSPETGAWMQGSPVKQTSFINVSGVGNARGIPHLPQGIPSQPMPLELESLNLVK